MTILWSAAGLLLKGSEQCLLCSKDLDSRSRKLSQICQTSSVSQKSSTELALVVTYVFTDQSSEIRSNVLHLLSHEALETSLEVKMRNKVVTKSSQ